VLVREPTLVYFIDCTVQKVGPDRDKVFDRQGKGLRQVLGAQLHALGRMRHCREGQKRLRGGILAQRLGRAAKGEGHLQPGE